MPTTKIFQDITQESELNSFHFEDESGDLEHLVVTIYARTKHDHCNL